MELGRKFIAALFVALLALSTAACSGEVSEDGAGVEVEGGEEGEGGDD